MNNKIKKIKDKSLNRQIVVFVFAFCLVIFALSIQFINNFFLFLSHYTSLPIADILSDGIYLLVCVLFFLTYRRLKETIKRQKELEGIIESIGPDLLLVTDSNDRILRSNSSLERMFGYRQDEMVHQKADILFDKTQSGSNEQEELVSFITHTGIDSQLAIGKKKSGEIFPVEIIKGEMQTQEGSVLLVRDITERQKAEETLLKYKKELETRVIDRTNELYTLNEELKSEINSRRQIEEDLRKSEEKLKALFEYAPVAYYLNDINGNILEANRVGKEMIGGNGDGLSDKNLLKLTPMSEEDINRISSILAKNSQGEPTGPDEFNFRKDGRFITAELRTYPVKIKDQTLVLSIARDITDYKRVEGEKKGLQEQLFHSQKMEAIGRLAGMMAKDFNNLLTPIRGCAELSLTKLNKQDPVYNHIQIIHDASIHAADLGKELLLFSGSQPMDKTSFSLNQSIEQTLKMLKPTIGGNIKVHSDLMPDLHKVLANEVMVEQMIMNLTVNAAEAMPKGGMIMLRTENVVITEEKCKEFPSARPGTFVCLSIEDTGPGMDAKIQQRIFEPFFSTKALGNRNGLGLTLVYSIVKQHNGWINFYSNLGSGTRFNIYLPAFLGKTEKNSEDLPPLKDLKGRGERVLLVEGNQIVHQYITDALREQGYVIHQAETFQEALDLFSTEKGRFDLIISDVTLADGNGAELAAKLTAENPEICVLLSCSQIDESPHFRMIEKKGYPLIQKPYSLNHLLKMIKDIIDERKKDPSPKQGVHPPKKSKASGRRKRLQT